MKSRKIILVVFLAVFSMLGITVLQDDSVFVENQFIDVKLSSDAKIITVGIADGVGSGDNG